jgi:hypothetical protein
VYFISIALSVCFFIEFERNRPMLTGVGSKVFICLEVKLQIFLYVADLTFLV